MNERASRYLLMSLVAYSAATTLHFLHNAVYLESYPNMPLWISGFEVYAALAGLLALGAAGFWLYRFKHQIGGLAVMGLYAGFGFDGLAHYTLASMSAHTTWMNLTIWFEVVSAAVLLVVVIACSSVVLLARPRSRLELAEPCGHQDRT